MEVVVRKTTRGPNFKKTLQVNESDTLYELKSKIFDVFGISPNTQYLHCYGKDLDGDTQTLERLGIKDESVIFIVQYASGRRKSIEEEQDQHMSNSAIPECRIMKSGINFESACKNSLCKAAEKLVIVNIGLRKSILQKDKWERNKCPACNSTCGDISRVIFKTCAWKYKGYTEKGELVEEEGNTQGEMESPSNNKKWSYLEISALTHT